MMLASSSDEELPLPLAVPAPCTSPPLASVRLADVVLTIPASAHTLEGFLTWVDTLPEKTRVTFFEGEVILDMSNEDPEFHVKVKGVIFATLYQLIVEGDLGEIYQDGLLLTNPKAKLSNNPDCLAALWS